MSTLAAHMVLASAEMEPRLFDLDLQLIADSVLMIIAVFTLFLVASHFCSICKRHDAEQTEPD